jgi:hypothetical protein
MQEVTRSHAAGANGESKVISQDYGEVVYLISRGPKLPQDLKEATNCQISKQREPDNTFCVILKR